MTHDTQKDTNNLRPASESVRNQADTIQRSRKWEKEEWHFRVQSWRVRYGIRLIQKLHFTKARTSRYRGLHLQKQKDPAEASSGQPPGSGDSLSILFLEKEPRELPTQWARRVGCPTEGHREAAPGTHRIHS